MIRRQASFRSRGFRHVRFPLRLALRLALRPTALAAVLLLAACAESSPLMDVPSQRERAPAEAFSAAADSARVLARAWVGEGHVPGVSVAVGRGGELVWAEAFGWADLSSDVLATPRTLYPVGSISKSFTATAAAVLRDRDQLDFDVPVQTYLPEFPEKRWPITTGQLMGHIAGVIRSRSMAETLRQAHCDNAMAAIDVVAEDTLRFEPGTKWQYSNFGYRLVGATVESVAGEPFLEFIDRGVFTPAGMERTVPDLGDEGPDEAVKYDRASLGVLRRGQEVDMSCSMAPGGFLSTPSDLVRFAHALLRGDIIEPETRDLLWAPQELASGARTEYGYGWGFDDVRLGEDEDGTTRMIGHGGAVLGGRATLMILPEEDMVVAVMTNATGDVSDLAQRIAGPFRDPR